MQLMVEMNETEGATLIFSTHDPAVSRYAKRIVRMTRRPHRGGRERGMKTIAMAWRNLFRQKRRTLITLSALIIGLCGVVVFQGYIASLMRGFRDSTIRVRHRPSADRRSSAGYFEDGEFNPFAFQIKDAGTLIAGLQQEPGVQAAFPSTGFTAMAGMGEKSVTLLMKAYPAERMYFAPARGSVPPRPRIDSRWEP